MSVSLWYKEHLDYDIVESSNPAFGKVRRCRLNRVERLLTPMLKALGLSA